MRNDRGTAMLELLVLGFAVVALFLPALLAVTRLAGARGTADTVAVDAAEWYARHGRLPPMLSEEVDLSIAEAAGDVQVRATVEVAVIDVGGVSITFPVTSVADVPISPYRSGR